MGSFIIPSIFTAVDKLSMPIKAMQKSISGLTHEAEKTTTSLNQRLERFSEKALNASAATGIAGAAILAPLGVAVKKAMDFETSLSSFRTIVSDLNDTQFDKFTQEILRVGDDTKRSYTDVASSFEKIAGLNAEFAETAGGLGLISKASITLSRAASQDLAPATESLVGIMNQFNLKAEQADRAINVLAAGQAVGAANITQTAEALSVFGAVAKGANITLEQSVGLIETLAQKSIMGSEAGTALRGSIVRLQKAGMGYKSGIFQINDALTDAKNKVDSLRSAKAQDAFITKMFGLENLTAGRILLDNIETYKKFTAGVTGTAEAQNQAAIRSKTLANQLKDSREQFENLMIVVGTKLIPTVIKLVNKLAPVIQSVTQWMEKNPKLTETLITTAAAVGGLLLAISSVTGVIGIVTKATWLFNAALWANPITWVIAAIVALIAVIVVVVRHIKGWGKQWDATVKWMTSVFNDFKNTFLLHMLVLKHGFMTVVEGMTRAWYWFQNKIGSISDEQYRKNIAQINAEKNARISAIRDTAAELMKTSNAASKGPGWHMSFDQDGDASTPNAPRAANPKAAQQSLNQQLIQHFQKQQTEITIKDQTGRAEVTKNTGGAMPKLTPTMASFKDWVNNQ